VHTFEANNSVFQFPKTVYPARIVMMRLLKAASVSTGFAFRKIIAAVMAIGHLSPNDPREKTILAVE
jgi:hypothetical protein